MTRTEKRALLTGWCIAKDAPQFILGLIDELTALPGEEPKAQQSAALLGLAALTMKGAPTPAAGHPDDLDHAGAKRARKPWSEAARAAARQRALTRIAEGRTTFGLKMTSQPPMQITPVQPIKDPFREVRHLLKSPEEAKADREKKRAADERETAVRLKELAAARKDTPPEQITAKHKGYIGKRSDGELFDADIFDIEIMERNGLPPEKIAETYGVTMRQLTEYVERRQKELTLNKKEPNQGNA